VVIIHPSAQAETGRHHSTVDNGQRREHFFNLPDEHLAFVEGVVQEHTVAKLSQLLICHV